MGNVQFASRPGELGDERLTTVFVGPLTHELAVIAAAEGGERKLFVFDRHLGVIQRHRLAVGVDPDHHGHICIRRHRGQAQGDHRTLRLIGDLDRLNVLHVTFRQQPHRQKHELLLDIHIDERLHLRRHLVVVVAQPADQGLRVLRTDHVEAVRSDLAAREDFDIPGGFHERHHPQRLVGAFRQRRQHEHRIGGHLQLIEGRHCVLRNLEILRPDHRRERQDPGKVGRRARVLNLDVR